MEHHNTSLLSRWRHVFLRGNVLQLQDSRKTSTRPWPQKKSRDDHSDRLGDEGAPLLEKSYSHIVSPSRWRSWSTAPSKASKISVADLTVPPSCRLPSSSRYTSLTTYFLITFLLFTSSICAAPLRADPQRGIVQRQAIPDRFGNTGNLPAPAAPPQPPQVKTPTTSPEAEPSTTSTTTTRVPSSSIITPSSIVTPPTPITISSPSSEASSTTLGTATSSSSLPISTIIPSPISIIIPLSTLTTTSSSTARTIPPPTRSPSPSNPDTQLQRTEPQNPLTPATIAGIVLGSIILLAFLAGIVFIFQRRKKDREVKEITIRRSKLGSRLGLRIFGSHYDDSIARSRKVSIPRDDSPTKQMVLDKPSITVKPPISPSIYSPLPLTRVSTFTFGSGMDKSQLTFTGTPSQLLVAPRPLFAPGNGMEKEKAIPARPRSAEPLGRLSGMGYGLGLR